MFGHRRSLRHRAGLVNDPDRPAAVGLKVVSGGVDTSTVREPGMDEDRDMGIDGTAV